MVISTGRYGARLESAFCVFAILIFSRVLVFHLFQPVSSGEEADRSAIANPELFWIYIFIYCGTGLLAIHWWRDVVFLLARERFLILILALAVFSSFWSLDSRETFVKAVSLSACTVFAVYLAARYRAIDQARLLAYSFGLIVIGCFVTVVFFPEYGISTRPHNGLWQGVFNHKNGLGKMISLGAIVFFLLYTRSEKYTRYYLLGFWLSLVLLVLSCSKSSLLSYSIVFTAMGGYLAVRRKWSLVTIALLSVVLAMGSFFLQFNYKIYPPIILKATFTVEPAQQTPGLSAGSVSDESSVDTLSDNPPSARFDTVTGRVRLWQFSWEMIQQRLLLGYGLGTFWIADNEPVRELWSVPDKWNPKSSHNGLVDAWLELGLGGLTLLLTSFGAAFYRSVQPLSNRKCDLHSLFSPAILAYIFLVHMAEGTLLAGNNILWILFVMIATSTLKKPPATREVSVN